MVDQTSDSVTLHSSVTASCDRPVEVLIKAPIETPVEVPASRLQAGQQVLHNGAPLKVRRVIPAFTRPHSCHVHLVPLNWQPLGGEGIDRRLADRDEAAVLVRVSCPVFKLFQVIA